MDNRIIRKIKNIWSKIKVNRGFQRGLKFLLYGSAAFLFLYTLLNLNIMFIEDVNVVTDKDLRLTTKEDLERLLNNNVGKRLYKIDINEEEEKVLNENWFIKGVNIEKIFPKTLKVEVVEREPLLVVGAKVEGGQRQFIISKDLFVLGECAEFESICEGLPKASLKDKSLKVNVGEKLKSKSVETIGQIETFLKEKDIPSKMYYIPEDSIAVVELEDDTRGIFTSDKSIREQLDAFLLTREMLVMEGEAYKEIDMRFERPVVRVDKYTL